MWGQWVHAYVGADSLATGWLWPVEWWPPISYVQVLSRPPPAPTCEYHLVWKKSLFPNKMA